MILHELARQVNVSLAILPSRAAGAPSRSAPRRNRDFVLRIRGIAALRHAGCVVEPTFTDDQGARLAEAEEQAPRKEVEQAIREMGSGRAAHAQRTLAEIKASRRSDAEQVDDLLRVTYEEHSRGGRSRNVVNRFLDTFERWLRPDGIVRVDLLFERVDLDRAPESLGILLLATTRLTRAHFECRESFFERLRRWLIGRSGRTEQDVGNMLRGLRE